MTITKVKNEPNAFWKIEGVIDSDNYHEFEKEILDLKYDGLTLTIDMKGVAYITSAAIRVLLLCRKKIEKENLRLLNVNDEIMEILHSSGFEDMVTFVKEEDSDEDLLHKSFKGLLDRMLIKDPDKEIYIMGEDKYTWMDVEKCSQIVADDLAMQGVTVGSHVGILSANCINWFITFFAIQKLGAIAVLLNFNLKKEEVVKLSIAADITHICYGILPNVESKIEYIRSISTGESKIRNVYNIEPGIDFRKRYDEYDKIKTKYRYSVKADNPAVIIFTSGSTGVPKGVVTSAYNRIMSALNFIEYSKASSEDKVCLYLPLFHALGFITMVIIPLIMDMSVYLCPNTKTESIIKTIYENKCTYFVSVPTVVIVMMNHKDFSSEKVASLRYTMVGGEPVSEQQMVELQKAFPNNHFGMLYAMSEIVPISLTHYDEDAVHIAKTVGKPYKDVKVRIVDLQTNKDVKTGEQGEIVVYSETSMIGYYKLAIDKQAMNDEGWIRTGDLGMIDDEGYLRITGRCKELIIRAGENISPNEIAAAIKEHGDIANVKVVGVPDKVYGEGIAAAIIMKNGHTFNKNEMIEFLGSKIAKFKIPAYYVEYDEFPLLSNGKMDGISLRKDMIEKLGL